MMKRCTAIFLFFLFALASCNFFEPQPLEPDQEGIGDPIPEKVELIAGDAVTVRNDETRATVNFTGAVDVILAAADFTVTDGADLNTVSISTDAVFVTVTFEANTTGAEKTYTVGIAEDSAKIKGDDKVTIRQAVDAKELRRELTAGNPVHVAGDATEADVTFTGAGGLTLTAADFAVTAGGATVKSASVSGSTVSVTVAFTENNTRTEKTYTVGIAPDSTRIKGLVDVDITQGPALLTVDSVNDLKQAIQNIKNRSLEADRVIRLTGAFYAAANDDAAGGFIAIDAGGTDNPIPYTIRGLGTKPGDPALKAGVLLANDNITLENIWFDISDSARAAPCSWEDYKTAVSIGRSSDGKDLLTGESLACKNVTVKNSIISITGTAGFTAGIYVCGVTDGSSAIYPSTNIAIEDNTITARGAGESAVQAINIAIWDPSIVITGNRITARYGTRPNPLGYSGGKPASAIYIARVFGENLTKTNTEPEISGNTLFSDVYSFYFNAHQVIKVQNKAGVDVLRDDNFAVAETTWALSSAADDDSVYKKLFNALKDNITGKGFGYVAIPVDWGTLAAPKVLFDVEQYEITNREVIAISVYGDHIDVSGAYAGDSGVNKFTNSGNGGYDYGRKLASAPTNYNNTVEPGKNLFCYGLNASGSGYEYDTDNDP